MRQVHLVVVAELGHGTGLLHAEGRRLLAQLGGVVAVLSHGCCGQRVQGHAVVEIQRLKHGRLRHTQVLQKLAGAAQLLRVHQMVVGHDALRLLHHGGAGVAGFGLAEGAQVGAAQRHELDRADPQAQPRQQGHGRGVQPLLHLGQQRGLVRHFVAHHGVGQGPGQPLGAAVDIGQGLTRELRQALTLLDQLAGNDDSHGVGSFTYV